MKRFIRLQVVDLAEMGDPEGSEVDYQTHEWAYEEYMNLPNVGDVVVERIGSLMESLNERVETRMKEGQ